MADPSDGARWIESTSHPPDAYEVSCRVRVEVTRPRAGAGDTRARFGGFTPRSRSPAPKVGSPASAVRVAGCPHQAAELGVLGRNHRGRWRSRQYMSALPRSVPEGQGQLMRPTSSGSDDVARGSGFSRLPATSEHLDSGRDRDPGRGSTSVVVGPPEGAPAGACRRAHPVPDTAITLRAGGC